MRVMALNLAGVFFNVYLKAIKKKQNKGKEDNPNRDNKSNQAECPPAKSIPPRDSDVPRSKLLKKDSNDSVYKDDRA